MGKYGRDFDPRFGGQDPGRRGPGWESEAGFGHGPHQGPHEGPRFIGRGGGWGRPGPGVWGGEGGNMFLGGPGAVRGRGRGGRASRGDVRAAIIALLAERPMHGYQIISELSDRTGGIWRPSPGSVYPTLQLLEEQGLIVGAEDEGKRVFSLTETGQEAARGAVGGSRAPWDAMAADVDPGLSDLRRDIGQVVAATRQIAMAGSGEQLAEAHRLLVGLRRSLYRILAEDPSDTDPGSGNA